MPEFDFRNDRFFKKYFEAVALGVRFQAMFSNRRKHVALPALAVTAGLFIFGCNNHAEMNQSSANVQHVTEAEFTNEVTHAAQPVVVDFYATWCGPCRALAPTMERLAAAYTGRIKFVKVNVDESPALARNYQVEGLPLVALFKDGQVVDRMPGLQPETELKLKMDALAAAK